MPKIIKYIVKCGSVYVVLNSDTCSSVGLLIQRQVATVLGTDSNAVPLAIIFSN